MQKQLQLDILPQPDDTTCGPTCLHSVYRFFDHDVPLNELIEVVHRLDEGGTLAVCLACDALRRGFDATIYTYNVDLFDPTWLLPDAPPLSDRLTAQMAAKDVPKLHVASRSYLEFLELGGKVKLEDLSGQLIRRYLEQSIPILTGLSATYLYRSKREFGPDFEPDDVRGDSCGHFVVLCGFDKSQRTVSVADPYEPNPLGADHYYEVGLDRVICSILLGVLTYDANLLIIQPKERS